MRTKSAVAVACAALALMALSLPCGPAVARLNGTVRYIVIRTSVEKCNELFRDRSPNVPPKVHEALCSCTAEAVADRINYAETVYLFTHNRAALYGYIYRVVMTVAPACVAKERPALRRLQRSGRIMSRI